MADGIGNTNFRWLINDIDLSMVIKVLYGDIDSRCLVFNVFDFLSGTGDSMDIETANIDDLSKMLIFGIIRFVNVDDASDILDIPFRNLYLLYNSGSMIGSNNDNLISMSKLDAFSIVDGNFERNFLISLVLVSDVSDSLKEIMKIAYEFNNYGMQEKFDALKKITDINNFRLDEEKNRNFK